jgi:hypothetical protein
LRRPIPKGMWSGSCGLPDRTLRLQRHAGDPDAWRLGDAEQGADAGMGGEPALGDELPDRQPPSLPGLGPVAGERLNTIRSGSTPTTRLSLTIRALAYSTRRKHILHILCIAETLQFYGQGLMQRLLSCQVIKQPQRAARPINTEDTIDEYNECISRRSCVCGSADR